jgi:uncharacterized protein
MSADEPNAAIFQDQPITQLLVKVATRCNIDCSYCYWFRDAAVYDKPKLMNDHVLRQLLQRIEQHIAGHSLTDFPIVLHGGEPLLFTVLPRPARAFHREQDVISPSPSRQMVC